MNRIAWITLAVMFVLLAALSVKKYALPALVSGGQTSPASTPGPVAGPAWPTGVPGPVTGPALPTNASDPFAEPSVRPPRFAPVPATAAQAFDANRNKEAAALKKLRDRMELERQLAGDPTPRVDTIVGTGNNRFSVMIGEALVPEGGTVQGYRVRKITADSVEFEKDGKTWVQKVN